MHDIQVTNKQSWDFTMLNPLHKIQNNKSVTFPNHARFHGSSGLTQILFMSVYVSSNAAVIKTSTKT